MVAPAMGKAMTRPPTLATLRADPDELDLWCMDCHWHATMPVATLLPRYAPDALFTDTWDGFCCSTCGSKRVDGKQAAAHAHSVCSSVHHKRLMQWSLRYVP
jgi:hypothetical protein